MEDKRGIKREHSPFVEGSTLPNDAKTPPSAPSVSPPPSGSPSEVSSRRPCSPVFEQGNASGKTPMTDLSSSSDDENFIVDTSRDAELAKKLFDDLNRDILGPLGDGKIIVIDDSEEENEAQEEKTIGIESTTASASTDPASSAPTSTDLLLQGRRSIIVMIREPIRRLMAATTADVAPVSRRLPHQEQVVAVGVLQGHP
jgi:hypothetical protein